MFSPADHALDWAAQFEWGRLCRTPLDAGVWALLEPMGSQNHAPQLCWIRPDLLGCVWMAGDQEGTAGMSIMLAQTIKWMKRKIHVTDMVQLKFTSNQLNVIVEIAPKTAVMPSSMH